MVERGHSSERRKQVRLGEPISYKERPPEYPPTRASSLDVVLGPAAVEEMTESERLAAKLGVIVRDQDMAFLLGGVIMDITVPGLFHAVADSRRLTSEQVAGLHSALSETMTAALPPMTPEEQAQADFETAYRRRKPTIFSGRNDR